MESERYKISVIGHTKKDGHIHYKINVEKNGQSFSFLERYSGLRLLNDTMKKHTNKATFPKFPPKKFFGSTDEKFLNQRQTELNSYFEQIFNSNEFSQLPSLKKWIEDSLKKHRKDGTKIKDNQIPSPSNNNNINNIQQ